MKHIRCELPAIQLVGIKVRTNNDLEIELDTANIGNTVADYFASIPETIPARKTPGTTYCAYTEYESDENGDYTFFIGEAVTAFDAIPDHLTTLSIPAQTYTRFTTEAGAMPEIVIRAWVDIWQMTPKTLGGERSYRTDFEIYDERAADPNNTVVDLYIGIEV